MTDTGGIASGVSDAVDKINYSRYGAEVDGENVFYVEDGANTAKDFIKFGGPLLLLIMATAVPLATFVVWGDVMGRVD